MGTIFTPWIGYEKVIIVKVDGNQTFIRYLIQGKPIGKGEWVDSSRVHRDHNG